MTLNPVMPVGAIAEAVGAPSWELRKAVRAKLSSMEEGPPRWTGGQRIIRINFPGATAEGLIAMAIVNRPRLLIADEPTTALTTVQAQILELLMDAQADA
jgi:ABC-type microcin C transport system duplicated ATPase subunit YejF